MKSSPKLGTRPKLLYFEDEQFFGQMFVTKLTLNGFDVVHETSPGKNPVSLVINVKPDLIIMDIIMPDMDGFHATRLIKADKRTNNIPVVGLSNLGQQADVRQAFDAGMADYWILANHTPSQLVELIRRRLGMGPREGDTRKTTTTSGPTQSRQITVAEAFGILDEINKSITWGGRNAREVQELVTLKESDWKKARRTFDSWVKNWRYVATWKIYAGLFFGVILWLVVPGGWKWAFGIVTVLFVYGLGYRDGTNSGWFKGYELGFRDVVFMLLGVSEDDGEKMREKAIQMESEEHVAEALKKKAA